MHMIVFLTKAAGYTKDNRICTEIGATNSFLKQMLLKGHELEPNMLLGIPQAHTVYFFC